MALLVFEQQIALLACDCARFNATLMVTESIEMSDPC